MCWMECTGIELQCIGLAPGCLGLHWDELGWNWHGTKMQLVHEDVLEQQWNALGGI